MFQYSLLFISLIFVGHIPEEEDNSLNYAAAGEGPHSVFTELYLVSLSEICTHLYKKNMNLPGLGASVSLVFLKLLY